jgi:outer membrane immunogenic protein
MRRLSLAIVGAGLLASSSAFAAPCPVLHLSGSNSASASSAVGGGQLGYSWQRGSFVYGLETDISAIDLRSEINTTSIANFCGVPLSVTSNTNADVNWYGTFRGRIGWSSGPILFYGTGGLAYGRVELNSILNASVSVFSTSLNAQTSSVKAGWVAGGGIEYALRPNVFLNLQYQYVDLGTITVSDPVPALSITLSQTAGAHARFSVATFGISWRFSPIDTSPQGPWEGAYFGGHIGGAWGNDTNSDYSVVARPGPS